MTIVALKKSGSRIAHVAVCLRSRQGQTHPLVQGFLHFFRSRKVSRRAIGTFGPKVSNLIYFIHIFDKVFYQLTKALRSDES